MANPDKSFAQALANQAVRDLTDFYCPDGINPPFRYPDQMRDLPTSKDLTKVIENCNDAVTLATAEKEGIDGQTSLSIRMKLQAIMRGRAGSVS